MNIQILSRLKKLLSLLFITAGFCVLLAIIGAAYLVYHYGKDLPNFEQLSNYNPPTVTRIYSSEGRIMAEYAKEKRLFVPIDAIPKKLINAFIAAEDQNFYTHPGIDVMSIARAFGQNVRNMGSNQGLVGGSTITQQVVKNFLLTNEKSIARKVKEAILALKLNQAYSKDKIMELYLNEIYLGNSSYGVAAAALNYFNKSIAELTIAEAAMLASLPKAPSKIDPRFYPERAIERRNWVIERMLDEGYITDEEAELEIASPLALSKRSPEEIVVSPYFSETVRLEMNNLFGEENVFKEGYSVHTTLDNNLQKYAERALRKGLIDYDIRHGFRGAVKNIKVTEDTWQEVFKETTLPPTLPGWEYGLVMNVTNSEAKIGLLDGKTGKILYNDLAWARKHITANSMGAKPKSPLEVLKVGDIIPVEHLKGQNYALRQTPKISGAIVAIDPHTGKVLAMAGGITHDSFNRATQAQRQPGSAFKPFVYLSALEHGFQPNSIILDAEISFNAGVNQPIWKPQNHTGIFYGPTPMRIGLEKSRNAMTVRLAQDIGIDNVVDIAKRFGINDNPQRNLSSALGTDETTLLNLTAAYAALDNGGMAVKPFFIEKVQDRNGKIVYLRDKRDCSKCNADDTMQVNKVPKLTEYRNQIVDKIKAYQILSMLEGVIKRGTGASALKLGKTLAGKTGTTNDSFDSWFIGFSPDLAVGVYAGFDSPGTLGKHEYGATISLPIWTDFMQEALKNRPDKPFIRPEGVKLVRVDINTGQAPTINSSPKDVIFESFPSDYDPFSYVRSSTSGPDESNFNSSDDSNLEGVY